MAILRLWPSTSGPSAVTVDSDNYTMGTEFTVTAAGATATAVYLWRPANAPATTAAFGVYQHTGTGGANAGTLLGSVTGVSIPANYNGWFRVQLATPIALTQGVGYMAVVQSQTDNFYSSTAGYWTGTGAGAAGITNGVLFAPQRGATFGTGQSRFAVGTTMAYPNQEFGGGNYWVDVEVNDGVSAVPAGSGSSTTTWSSTATGTTVKSGSGSSSTTWSSTGAGVAPSIGTASGSGTTTTTWSSSASGARASSGSGSSTVSWTGTLAGPTSALTIAQENALPGRSWNLWGDGVGSEQMPAFARSSYYQPGETAEFSVNFNASFTYQVIRMGHYDDDAGRRVAGPLSGTPAAQPTPNVIPNSNGAVDCAHWTRNVSWPIPADAVPGWYYLFLTDGSANYGHVLFCVTDKLAKKPVLAISGDATWGAAYNGFGGNNLYGNIKGVGDGTNRALASSYDKPVISRDYVAQTHFFNAAFASFKYLESLGVEVGYATIEQINNDPSIMDGRQVIVFSGHNEYVSQPVMDKTKQLLAAGQKIVNWAGNDFFWRVKFGSTAGMNTPGRVVWCKKDTMPGPNGTGHVAGTPFTTAADWTGTWQDTRWAGREPTADFLGDRFIANGIRNDQVRVPFAMKTSPLWRDCAGVQALTSGQAFLFGAGTLGMEWDMPDGPLQQVRLSSASVTLTNNAADLDGQNYNLTLTAEHSIALVRSGPGLVFNFNSDQWGKALDNRNIRHGNIANVNARQACLNMLVDLGVTPSTTMVSAAGLTMPTPVSGDVGEAYGLTAPPPPSGSGTSTTTWASTGTGASNRAGAGTSTTTWSSDGTGTMAPVGSGTSTTAWSGSGDGATSTAGTGSSTTAWSSTGTGTAPVIGEANGSGATSTAWAGTLAGTTEMRGTGSTSTSWTSTGTGTAPPTPGVPAGSGTSLITWGGTLAGSRSARGAGSSTTTWTGTLAGPSTAPPRRHIHVGPRRPPRYRAGGPQ